MPSGSVPAQDLAVRILKAHLKSGRLAPTYMMTGGSPADQEALATAFAKVLNCEKRVLFEPCDCGSCVKIESRHHPDIQWVGREGEGGSIKMETIRQVIRSASLKPYEGRWKVTVFVGADRLTLDAANALLKTLEEPPASSLFMLLVENKTNLLETVQSRSFEIRLRPVRGDSPEEGRRGSEEAFEGEAMNWEERLEKYQTAPREELKAALDRWLEQWMESLRSGLRDKTLGRNQAASRVKALDFFLEAKDALETNANQKLALTWLTMRLNSLSRRPRN